MTVIKAMPTRRPNGLLLLVLAVLFMLLPAMLAMADVPGSRRADAAVKARTADMARLAVEAGSTLGAPVYLRITKQPAELTAFIQKPDGTFAPLKTWDICTFSGGLGPKKMEGDGKSPEGFYSVRANQMNPSSSFHLSFNLGFPNVYDRAQGYTGSYLMVHGDCVSIGCYAMTDDGIEEIWTVMAAALEGGQRAIPVHVFPFPMPGGEVPDAYADHPAATFWDELAPAWAAFEETRRVPTVTVRDGRYSVSMPGLK